MIGHGYTIVGWMVVGWSLVHRCLLVGTILTSATTLGHEERRRKRHLFEALF